MCTFPVWQLLPFPPILPLTHKRCLTFPVFSPVLSWQRCGRTEYLLFPDVHLSSLSPSRQLPHDVPGWARAAQNPSTRRRLSMCPNMIFRWVETPAVRQNESGLVRVSGSEGEAREREEMRETQEGLVYYMYVLTTQVPILCLFWNVYSTLHHWKDGSHSISECSWASEWKWWSDKNSV